jgi:[ribosomal protein S18]-alanine N-acetyltransferase
MLEPALQVRPARPDDITALLALEQTAATAAHWSPARYADLFPAEGRPPVVRRVVVVAEINASICAFAVARVVPPEWEIENVVVADAARRKGVGRALLQAIGNVARAERATKLTLEVRESNLAARRLYERLGFAECGLRPGYYRSPDEAAILYELRFQ